MRIPLRMMLGVFIVGVVIPLFILWPRERKSPQQMIGFKDDKSKSRHKLSDTDVVSPAVWRSHIARSCQKLGLHENNNLTRAVLQHILVDDTHKLLYCAIPKVASTTWRRIFILLSGNIKTKDLASISANDVHHKYAKNLTYLSDFPREGIVRRINTYFKFLFVREPFERILSAFRNKFLTNTNSSTYFKRAFGRKIINTYRPDASLNHNGEGLLFEEFIAYLTDYKSVIKTNEHWERFHILCNPCLINYDFIGKLETIERDSQFVLDKMSLSEWIKLPSRSELKYATELTNSFMEEFYGNVSRHSIVQLFKKYQADFLIFNYTMPQVIRNLMLRKRDKE